MATDIELRSGVARAIEPYRDLLERFVRGDLPADEFQSRYLAAYLNDESDCPDEVFVIVDRFFAEVDSFVADPGLRKQVYRGVAPGEMKQRAKELLRSAGCADEPSSA